MSRFLYMLQDQYIEISTLIPASATLFGLGEHTSTFGIALRRDGVPYALWNRDQPPAVPNVGVYGSYPFYMDVREGARHASGQLVRAGIRSVHCTDRAAAVGSAQHALLGSLQGVSHTSPCCVLC